MKAEIKIEGGQTIVAKCAIVGGVLDDDQEGNFPFGMFLGDLNIAKTALVMEHAIRASLKILVDENGLTYQEVNELFEKITAVAIAKEIDSKSAMDSNEIVTKFSKTKK